MTCPETIIVGIPADQSIKIEPDIGTIVQVGIPADVSVVKAADVVTTSVNVTELIGPTIVEVGNVSNDSIVGKASFIQSTPSSAWYVYHGLSTYPQVTIVIAGEAQEALVTYPNTAMCIILFNSPVAGSAYLVG